MDKSKLILIPGLHFACSPVKTLLVHRRVRNENWLQVIQYTRTIQMLSPKPAWREPLFPWPQHQITANGRRTAYIDEGNRAGRPVLLLSGTPTWGFLYRDFIKPLTEAGYRAGPSLHHSRVARPGLAPSPMKNLRCLILVESAAEVPSGIACLCRSALW